MTAPITCAKSARTLVLVVLAAAFCCVLPRAARAVVNGGFETGDMTGWTVVGDGTAQTDSVGVTPTAGTYQGYLDSTGNYTAYAPPILAALGVSDATILSLGAGTPTNGTGIVQTITVAAGDTLYFDWNFLTDELDELEPYNDFAYYTIDAEAFFLASRDASTFNTTSPPPGFDGQTGWDTESYTFTTPGTHTVGLGVFNVGDTGHNSVLLLDAIGIPEPTACALLVVGACLLLPRRLTRG